MAIQIIPKDKQASGQFNGGAIIENKPIGFPQEGGHIRPYSNLFYWAYAEALEDSTIGLHPHQGFEIMSFVLQGNIRHFDTKLKEWRPLEAGDVQIIRAGKGISHAEHLAKNAAIFQIWVDPDLNKTLQQEASYDDFKASDFSVSKDQGIQITNYTGGNAPLKMDAKGISIQRLEFGQGIFKQELDEGKIHSIYVVEGTVQINGQMASKDSFVIVSESSKLQIESNVDAALFMISSPKSVDYKTYAEIMQERRSVK